MNRHDDALETTAPTPQDYGFPASPSLRNIQCWDYQEAFLKAYGELGTIIHAARAVGIHRMTVNTWLTSDLYSFRKRMDLAHDDYVENVGRMMNERLANPTGNRGSDVLLMFKLKAEAPQKYREEVKVVGIEAPKQMMNRLREMATKERQRELEAPAIEGEYKEVPLALTPPPTPPPAEPPPRPPVPVLSPPTTVRPSAKIQLMERRAGRKVSRR
jgi:hypothetical protein